LIKPDVPQESGDGFIQGKGEDCVTAGLEVVTLKLDRLIGILTTLLQNKRVTAPYLAEKFEVSRRTISRDIDALCMAGIPIVTQQGGSGGISIAEGYKLDKSVLTSDELSNMIAALKGLGSVTEKTQMERMLEKLSVNSEAVVSLRESVVIDLASHHKGILTDKLELIKRAVREQRLIEFIYCYDKGESLRRIEPYFIAFQWTSWYVFGYCTDRQDWRLFKLARLRELKSCDQRFTLRQIPPERLDFNSVFTDNLRLIALFDPSVKYQLIEYYGPDCYTEADDGRLRLEIRYTNRDYIINWILAFGDKATVLDPPDIAEEILRIAKKIIKNYE
jgi:predicted DNA-binding transcriptional regulator YafY